MAIGFGNRAHLNQPMSEINVTPFVDVMLVLLVIFMVTAPMMVQGLDVSLPKAEAQPVKGADEKITITLMKNKRVYIGDTEVAIDRLGDLLAANEKLKKDKEILLHADASLPYGFIIKIMALAKKGGAQNIGMITDPVIKAPKSKKEKKG